MTNVRRPIHLQLRPSTGATGGPLGSPASSLVASSPMISSHAATTTTSSPVRPNALMNFNTTSSTTCRAHHRHHQQLITSSSPRHLANGSATTTTTSWPPMGTPKALSPSGGLNDPMPSQILPHLFVGNQEQTNRETVNKLNIKYILSLGLLPIVLSSSSTLNSPAGTTTTQSTQTTTSQQAKILMPSQNSSKDFKIRIRSNTPTPTTSANNPPTVASTSAIDQTTTTTTITNKRDAENKCVKSIRSIHCKCINISDNSDQLLMKFFDEAYAFIEEARRKKCNILIHCLAGISRSPTIAIAYLMRVKELHWKEAYELVKQCRPQIDPNLNFMGQLRIYNKSLKDERQQQLESLPSVETATTTTTTPTTTTKQRKRSSGNIETTSNTRHQTSRIQNNTTTSTKTTPQ